MRKLLILILPFFIANNLFADEGKKWNDDYQNALREAVEIYDQGDEVYKDQMYELGRTFIVKQLYYDLPNQLKSGKIDQTQYLVLQTVLKNALRCSSAGGCNVTTIKDLPIKKVKAKIIRGQLPPTRLEVKEFITNYVKKNKSLNPGIVYFLVTYPSSWEALQKGLTKCPSNMSWKQKMIRYMQDTNKILTYTGKKLKKSYPNLHLLIGAVPPAARVYFIETVCSSKMDIKLFVNSVNTFIHYNQTYIFQGWRGLSGELLKTKKRANLGILQNVLISKHILLYKVDLKNDASKSVNSFTEEQLNNYFNKASIFNVPS